MRQSFRKAKKPERIVSEEFEFGIFSKKEVILMIIFALIGSFISFIPIIPDDEPLKIISRIIIFSIIISFSMFVKKIIGRRHSIRIEHRIAEFKRWGLYKRSELKRSFPIGLVLPFFLSLFSLGILKPFLFLQFDAEDISSRRLLKSIGGRRAVRKDYINEEDIGYTSASGFYSLLVLAIIGALISYFFKIDFGSDLAKFSIYYGIWNLLPILDSDGIKLFFGAFMGWVFILILNIIGLGLILIF